MDMDKLMNDTNSVEKEIRYMKDRLPKPIDCTAEIDADELREIAMPYAKTWFIQSKKSKRILCKALSM